MNEEWVYYDDLKKKYFYNKNKIINSLLQKGFQPYDANGDPVYCPDEYHKFSYLDKKRRKEFPGLRLLRKEREKILYEGVQGYKTRREISDEDIKWLNDLIKIRSEMRAIVDEEPELSKGWREGRTMELSWKNVRVPDDSTKKEELYSKLRDMQFKKEEVDAALQFKKPVKKIPEQRNRPFTEVMKRAIQYYKEQNPDKEPNVDAIQKLIKKDHNEETNRVFDPDGVVEKVIGKYIFQIKENKNDKKKSIDRNLFRKRLKRLIKKDKTG